VSNPVKEMIGLKFNRLLVLSKANSSSNKYNEIDVIKYILKNQLKIKNNTPTKRFFIKESLA